MTFSILIRNGTIYDGSGAAGFLADVGIQDGRIAAIGSLSEAEAETVIEAQGLAVAPGFIDMHSHGDFVLPFLPTADSKVHQGITLEVVGNCGSSMAPINADMGSQIIFDQDMLTDAVIDWSSFGEFLARLRRTGISVNVASLVGHGTIREKVMGMTDAPPNAQQLAAMQDEVRRAMQEGAVGLSTGLIYPPSIYGDVDEIAALAEVVAEHGGIYTSHIRGEGNTLIEAISEALEVGRRAQVRVQISHLKASGVRNWHKMPQALQLLEQARSAGIDVMADMYTYPASNTSLSSLVPAWAHVGGRDAMIARLQDPAVRARIHHELADAVDANGVDWDQIYISSCTARQDYEGRHLARDCQRATAAPVGRRDGYLDRDPPECGYHRVHHERGKCGHGAAGSACNDLHRCYRARRTGSFLGRQAPSAQLWLIPAPARHICAPAGLVPAGRSCAQNDIPARRAAGTERSRPPVA
jgi:N-acyl-D-amino-acid deacylase